MSNYDRVFAVRPCACGSHVFEVADDRKCRCRECGDIPTEVPDEPIPENDTVRFKVIG